MAQRSIKGKRKIAKVMREKKHGTLKSGSGHKVKSREQAVAIALPREIHLHVADDEQARAWDWPIRLQKALGRDDLHVEVSGEN